MQVSSRAATLSQVTDSVVTGRPGKRERLVASAAELLHRDGLERTTIARVAEAADVPVGNVYYYFKTRDDLIRAVIDERCSEMSQMFQVFESRSAPRARLKALLRQWGSMAEIVACSGCPIGTLAADVAKHGAGLEDAAGLPLQQLVAWTEDQFAAMGRRDARTQAITLIGAVQGATVLSNAFRDPQLLAREVRRLEKVVDALDAS